MPATEGGRKAALEALAERRKNKPKRIDNSSLVAFFTPMYYYYCISCGHISGVLPESHLSAPPKLCKECQALKDLGWLE